MASAATIPKPAFSGPLDALGRYLLTTQGARYGPGNPSVEAAGFGYAEDNLPTKFTEQPYGPNTTPPPVNGPAGSDPSALANDWYKAFFANYGVPADVQGNLLDILKKYASDPSTAQALSTQYLRTTPWYQTAFPGFSAGVNNGIFTDETGYRGYLNSINNVYNQYLGRHVSGDEVSALLAEGVSPSTVANRFQGQAYINANRNDIQYLGGAFGEGQMNKDQLTALGNENAGIDTQMGQIQQKVLAKAQQIRDKLYTGSLATPGLSLGANGLNSPSLAGTRGAPDVQA